MMRIVNALYSIRPNSKWKLTGDSFEDLEWWDISQSKPTKEEVEAEIARQEAQFPLDQTKAKAKELLAATDWSVLPDVGLINVSEYQTYRATLRELIKNPVANPDWPTEPTPVWE